MQQGRAPAGEAPHKSLGPQESQEPEEPQAHRVSPEPPTATRADSGANDGITAALMLFAELVAPDGPLCVLRFAQDRMAPCLGAYDQAPKEADIERHYANQIRQLVTPAWLDGVARTLRHFIEADYVDVPHKVAAKVALGLWPRDAAHRPANLAHAPPLYIIYRAQVLADTEATVAAPVDKPTPL